jgi:hypothetical protein
VSIVWENPSPKGKWISRLEPLMTEPGRWARISEHNTPGIAASAARNLKHMLVKPPGKWEFTSRSDKDNGRGYVYARYLGPEE